MDVLCPDDILASCDECKELSFEVCDDITISAGLTPTTTYYIQIIDKFGKVYKQTVLTDISGDFTIDVSSLPQNLFNQHAGDFELVVYPSAYYVTPSNLTFAYTTYECVIMSFVAAAPVETCCDPDSASSTTPCEDLITYLEGLPQSLQDCVQDDFCTVLTELDGGSLALGDAQFTGGPGTLDGGTL